MLKTYVVYMPLVNVCETQISTSVSSSSKILLKILFCMHQNQSGVLRTIVLSNSGMDLLFSRLGCVLDYDMTKLCPKAFLFSAFVKRLNLLPIYYMPRIV